MPQVLTIASPGIVPWQGGTAVFFSSTANDRAVAYATSADGFDYGPVTTMPGSPDSCCGVTAVYTPACGQIAVAFNGIAILENGEDYNADVVALSSDLAHWQLSGGWALGPSDPDSPNIDPSPDGVYVDSSGVQVWDIDGYNTATALTADVKCDGSSPTNGFVDAYLWLSLNTYVFGKVARITTPDGTLYSAWTSFSDRQVNIEYGQSDHIVGLPSTSGVSLAYDPDNGDVYVAYTTTGDNNYIVITNIETDQSVESADWSNHEPTMIFYNGQLLVAWQGGDGTLNIASHAAF